MNAPLRALHEQLSDGVVRLPAAGSRRKLEHFRGIEWIRKTQGLQRGRGGCDRRLRHGRSRGNRDCRGRRVDGGPVLREASEIHDDPRHRGCNRRRDGTREMRRTPGRARSGSRGLRGQSGQLICGQLQLDGSRAVGLRGWRHAVVVGPRSCAHRQYGWNRPERGGKLTYGEGVCRDRDAGLDLGPATLERIVERGALGRRGCGRSLEGR